MKKLWKQASARYARVHTYTNDVILGSAQLTGVLYLFALAARLLAPYSADYFRTLAYSDAAIAIAPVTFSAGLVAALLCDLILRDRDARENRR